MPRHRKRRLDRNPGLCGRGGEAAAGGGGGFVELSRRMLLVDEARRARSRPNAEQQQEAKGEKGDKKKKKSMGRGAEMSFLRCHSILKPNIYQDRLGTNTGNVGEKTDTSVSACRRCECDNPAQKP